jgi:GTPase SAR1 family protein
VILLGDFGVGKSTFVKQALKPKKPKADEGKRGGYVHDVRSLMIKDDDRGWIDVSLDIYDTNGDEEFATLQKDYYAKAHGGIVMYDLTKKSSFDNAELWVKENLRFSERNSQCVMFILGTNKDQVEKDKRKRVVSHKNLQDILMQGLHMTKLGEISTMKKDDVDKVLVEVAYSLTNTFPHRIKSSSIYEAEIASKEKASCGCTII